MARPTFARMPQALSRAARDADVIRESRASRPAAGAPDIPKPAGLDDNYLPYQKAGIQFASERNTLIGDEMGLGKTVQALGAANNLQSDRVLIIAPPSLLVNWKKEADKWIVGDPPIHIVTSGKAEDWQMPETGPGITVIGYSNLGKHRKAIRQADWDMVILDEAHYVGNPDSQRTQEVVGCVADACRSDSAPARGTTPIPADRKLLLTGTPFDAKVQQMWPMVSYLAPEVWGRTNDPERRREFQSLFWDAQNKRGKNLRELQKALRGSVMLRRTGDDVVDQVPLGPIERRTIILEPGTTEERQAINRAGDLNIGPTEADISRPENTPKFSEISAVLAQTAIAKAPQVGRYTVAAARKEPVVFFAHHKPLLHSVSRQLTAAGVKHDVIDGDIAPGDRAKAVQRFQEGKTQAILLSLGTGKEGFTLTRSRRAIFGDLSWRPTDLLQAEKRIHRIGQRGDVLVEYLVLDDSLDAMQAEVMARKMASIAGGIGVSESAAEFGGVDSPDVTGDDAPQPVSQNTIESRATFCNSAPATARSRQIVRKWANNDLKLSEARLKRAAAAAGIPDPTQPVMRRALAETERVVISNKGKPVLLMDEDASVPELTAATEVAKPVTPPAPEPEPFATPVPEPPPPPDLSAATEPTFTEPPSKPKTPFPKDADLEDADVLPLKVSRKWGRMTTDEQRDAVARFNQALHEYQQTKDMVEAIDEAENHDAALDVYCGYIQSILDSGSAPDASPDIVMDDAPAPAAAAPRDEIPMVVVPPPPASFTPSYSAPIYAPPPVAPPPMDIRSRAAAIARERAVKPHKPRSRAGRHPYDEFRAQGRRRRR